MGKREPVALLNLSSLSLVVVGRLFLAVAWGCLRFVIVVFPDHTHLLFLINRLLVMPYACPNIKNISPKTRRRLKFLNILVCSYIDN